MATEQDNYLSLRSHLTGLENEWDLASDHGRPTKDIEAALTEVRSRMSKLSGRQRIMDILLAAYGDSFRLRDALDKNILVFTREEVADVIKAIVKTNSCEDPEVQFFLCVIIRGVR